MQDRMNQADGMQGALGCGHPGVVAGAECPLCGELMPGSPNSCKGHTEMIPGEKCPVCDWIIPCPHCGCSGNIGDNGCMNCGWGSGPVVKEVQPEDQWGVPEPPEEKS